MKSWQQMLLAWLLFVFYLLAGAFLFRAIELPQERLAGQEFSQTVEEFLQSHPCLSKEELLRFGQLVVEAADSGVYDFAQEKFDDRQVTGVHMEQKGVWDLPNSFFFSATVVTTIGYGDLTPQTSVGRAVCMIYGVIGLPLTAWVIGVIARSLTAYWTKALDRADKILLLCVKFARLRKTIMILITILVLYAILLQVPAVLLGHIENWDVLTGVYYCFITLTTIGFGDLVVGNHPDFSQAAKWTLKMCMVLYVMLGLSLLVALTSAISERANKTVKKSMMPGNSYRIERKQSKKERKRLDMVLENEVALRYVPDLSFARLTESSEDSKVLGADVKDKDTEVEVTIEMHSLGNMKEDVLPYYEEIFADMSASTDTLCINMSMNGSKNGLPARPTEQSLHCTSLDNDNSMQNAGNVSAISRNEYGRVDFHRPSIQ